MIRNPSSRACSSASALALSVALLATASAPPRRPRPLLRHPYPIEAAPSFAGGLFHWIDSLAGTSAGKTIPAHREDYVRRFGPLAADDRAALDAFVAARAEHMQRHTGSAMLGIFCARSDLADAIEAIRPELSVTAWKGLADALAHFEPKYRIVWAGGAIPQAFLDRARHDRRLDEMSELLEKVVRFYGVDPNAADPPRLALVPVPGGYGTHAEAIGHVLLLEIREGEGLADEASVIVHENAHFLWSLVPEERKSELASVAAGMDTPASRAFGQLGEAIPTALGQGVADREFRPSLWSLDGPWYHRPEIDLCAKRIYPVVRYAIEAGGRLDDDFLVRVLAAATRDAPTARRPTVRPPPVDPTPR